MVPWVFLSSAEKSSSMDYVSMLKTGDSLKHTSGEDSVISSVAARRMCSTLKLGLATSKENFFRITVC
jgi:hypothetical protein